MRKVTVYGELYFRYAQGVRKVQRTEHNKPVRSGHRGQRVLKSNSEIR